MRVEEALSELHSAAELLRAQFPEIAADDEVWLSSIESLSDGLDLAEALAERALYLVALQAAAIERARTLQARAKRFEAEEERLRGVITALVEAAGGKKIVRAGLTLSPRTLQPKVVATDEAATPAEYLQTVTVQKPDRRAIRDALELGAEVPGWYLSNSQRSVAILVK
jgi:hypothetical protein